MIFSVEAPFILSATIEYVGLLHGFFLVVQVAGIFLVRWPQMKAEKREADKAESPPKPEDAQQAVWVIHGKRYDLTSYMQHHPGGKFALQLAQGTDCTGLFESYHVFADRNKQLAMMKKYEVPEDSALGKDVVPRPQEDTGNFNCPFHEDVKQMCREHFAGKGKNAHRVKTTHMIWHLVVAALMIFGMYRAFRYHEWTFCVLTALCASHLTYNVAHDASHFVYSSNWKANRILSMAGFPFSFNSAAWHLQHVAQHHIFTNSDDDVDLHHFLPILRVSKSSKFAPVMRLQPIIFLILLLPTAIGHLLFTVPVDIMWGTRDPVTGEKRYEQARNLVRFRTSVFREMLFELALVPLVITVAVITGGSFFKAFPLWCFIWAMCSVQFLFVTQITHLQAHAFEATSDESWAKRQALSAYDYAQHSFFWSQATGGLNMQALHHTLPGVSSSHYRDMYPKFRAICEKHKVPLMQYPSALRAALGFFSWICELSDGGA